MLVWVVWFLVVQWGPVLDPGPYGEGSSQDLLHLGRLVDQPQGVTGYVFCAPRHDRLRGRDVLMLQDQGVLGYPSDTLTVGPRNHILQPVAVADSGVMGCGWTTPEGTTLQVVSLDLHGDSIRTVPIPFPDTIRAFRIHALETGGWLVTAWLGNTLYTLLYDPIRRKVVWGPRIEARVDLQNVRLLGFSRTPRNEPVVFGYDSLNHALGFAGRVKNFV